MLQKLPGLISPHISEAVMSEKLSKQSKNSHNKFSNLKAIKAMPFRADTLLNTGTQVHLMLMLFASIQTNIDRTSYETIHINVVRRGVIGVNKIGYVL